MPNIHVPLPVARVVARAGLGSILTTRLSWSRQRALIELAARTIPLPPRTETTSLTLGGRPAEQLTVGRPGKGSAVLYLHGGGFTVASIASHRSLAAGIAQRTGGAVYTLDYRLAPEHPFPAAVDDAVAAFGDLVEVLGHSVNRIAIVGDSAGGNLALVTARRVIDQRNQRPAALALLSPWVDPGAVLPAERDTVLNTPWLHACAAAYLGAADPKDASYAPLHGDLAGLPPTIVQIGTTELFYPQVTRLAQGIEAADGDVTLQEYSKLWHVAQLYATQVREAAEAVDEIGRFLRVRLETV